MASPPRLVPGPLTVVRPPPPGPTVCPRCWGPTRPGRGECWCCRRVGLAIGEPPGVGPPVVVGALCRPGDTLHRLLRGYKDGPVAAARRHHVVVLGGLLEAALATWWDDVAGGVDAVVPVPSSGRGVGPQPPCPVADLVGATARLSCLPVVRLGRGPSPCGHLHPSASAFAAPPELSGRRVLVIEDTWVTGARARSASATVVRAGGHVVAVAVVGRVMDPQRSPWRSAWWDSVAGGVAGTDAAAAGMMRR